MEKQIKDFYALFPLNLKVKASPFYNSDGKFNGGVFRIYNSEDDTLITNFTLEAMGGCNGVCISRRVEIMPQYRGKGYGGMLCQFREKLGRYFGYSAMMCSVVDGNIPQEKIMFKNGWAIISSFHNKRTGNDVNIFFKTF